MGILEFQIELDSRQSWFYRKSPLKSGKNGHLKRLSRPRRSVVESCLWANNESPVGGGSALTESGLNPELVGNAIGLLAMELFSQADSTSQPDSLILTLTRFFSSHFHTAPISHFGEFLLSEIDSTAPPTDESSNLIFFFLSDKDRGHFSADPTWLHYLVGRLFSSLVSQICFERPCLIHLIAETSVCT